MSANNSGNSHGICRLAVIGNPIKHSLSPLLHGYLLRELDVKGDYQRREVTESGLPSLLEEFRSANYTGFNVTIPFKQTIKQHLDEIDISARDIGAVNTVKFKDGKATGYNTDAYGFVQSLLSRGVNLTGAGVVVLGAGGAARAALHGVISKSVRHIVLINRTHEKALELAENVRDATGFRSIEVHQWHEQEILHKIKGNDILVNTTSIGMWPDSHLSPVSTDFDGSNLVVVDLVYNPLDTQLLQLARKCGARTVDGLDMFIYQGVKALEIWLEQPVAFEHSELRKHLVSNLEDYAKN